MLVLVEFAGPVRTRLAAYLGLGASARSSITLGTLCSRNAWLAAGAMAVVGFGVLFSGVFSGYFAAGATGALLTFVLPVTIPAPNSAIPDRLEGWGLAVGAGDLRRHVPLAAAPARRPPARGRRRDPCRRGSRRGARPTSAAERAPRRTCRSRPAGTPTARHAASPEGPDKADRRPRVAPRRARLAALLPHSVGDVAGARHCLRRRRRSGSGHSGRAPRRRRTARGR